MKSKIESTLDKMKRRKDRQEQSVKERRKILAIRIMVNLFIVIIIGALFYAIWYITGDLVPELSLSSK